MSCPGEYDVDALAAATSGWAASHRLGGGGFGDVYRGCLDGCEVAIKKVHGESLQGAKEFEAEIRVLSKMRDPSLVRLLGHGRRGAGDFCLVYELCAGGTLEDRLEAADDQRLAGGGKSGFGWGARLDPREALALAVHRCEGVFSRDGIFFC